MKKFKKISKWFLIILFLLILTVISVVAMRQDLRFDAPYPDIHASNDSSVIARGEHIVFSQAHCGDCHSTTNADSLFDLGIRPVLSGGKLFDVDIAKIYSANLTPDSLTGIGRRTDAEIARVIRYGVHANGKAVFNFMGFANMSDEDLTAVISYLRTQEPVVNKVPPHEFNAVGKAVQAFLIKPVGPAQTPPKQVSADSTAAYGEYLVHGTTNCAGCHTQRDLAGNFSGPLMAGGNLIEGIITPNLTPDSSSRIFGWTEQMFLERIRRGKLVQQSVMPWSSFRRMSDLELKAIYRYLQTVPPAKQPAVQQ